MDALTGADHRVVPLGTGGAARHTLRLLAVGLLVGVLLGAVPLRQWTEGLDGGTALNRAAAWWETVAGQAGLNRPYQALRQASRRLSGS